MFAKIFESDPLRYYLPSELTGIPSGTGTGSLYNPFLVTPPRIYAEQLWASGFLLGAFTRKERTPYSDFTLHVMSSVDSIYYPGYAFRHWWLDGVTGVFLGTDNNVTSTLFGDQIYQARDGGLWVMLTSASYFYEAEQLTYTEISGTRKLASDFGATTVNHPMVDRSLDLVVMKTDNEALNQIGVYTLSTGALVRRINLSGAPLAILPEDAKRCYVVHTNYLLSLIDYTTGEVISTLKAPGAEAGAIDYLFTWDRFLRRILVFTQRPNDTDGACLSTFSGYYPVPLSTGITAPIPLRAPRANRSTPFLAKVYGDAGEAITGVKITPTIGASQIVGAPPFTDSDGEAIITIIPSSGTDTLTVTADV